VTARRLRATAQPVNNAAMNDAQTPGDLPDCIADEAQLDDLLSRPPAEVVDVLGRLEGDLAVVGGGGKIGPSLARMACRARDAAAGARKVFVIDQFGDPAIRDALAAAGAETVACDLFDPSAVAALPEAANVIYMVGMKFGTSQAPALTWAVNALIPAAVAERYRDARIVTFSTGCVYALTPAGSAGSVETDPLEPIGEYANACVARERIFEFLAARHGTPMVQVRLNYAVEMRYGVLVDLAQAVAAGRAIDVTMGQFNCIWQADVNAAVLRLIDHAACPPLPINLTGPDKLAVRDVATRLGERMGKAVTFSGSEADTALLSDASKARQLLGAPPTPIGCVIDWTADWVARGRPTLGKPTHFQSRDGRY